MQEGPRSTSRRLAVTAVGLAALGSVLVGSAPASASARGAFAVIKFWPTYNEVTLEIPVPPCRNRPANCVWKLMENEPDVPAQTVVGTATGTSGILTVPYPTNFCGLIQADALVESNPDGASPWSFQIGRRTTIQTIPTCTRVTPTGNEPTTTTTTTKPPAAAPPAQLPFTGSASTSTTDSVLVAKPDATQLPFTGVDVKPLAIVGASLILLALSILTTLEQRRRGLRRAGDAVRTGAVGLYDSRASQWFLGE
jgi:hypothetical protein